MTREFECITNTFDCINGDYCTTEIQIRGTRTLVEFRIVTQELYVDLFMDSTVDSPDDGASILDSLDGRPRTLDSPYGRARTLDSPYGRPRTLGSPDGVVPEFLTDLICPRIPNSPNSCAVFKQAGFRCKDPC